MVKTLHISDNEQSKSNKLTKEYESDSTTDSIKEEPAEIITKIDKPKKPRSEKQIEAFKIASGKRKDNLDKIKEIKKIEAAKLLMNVSKTFEEKIKEKPKNLK
jgi:hypothetical protein